MPPEQFQNLELNAPKKRNTLIWSVALVAVLFLTAAAAYFLVTEKTKITELKSEIQEIDEGITESNTSNWLTYRNDEYGFELRHPPDWSLASGSGQSRLLTFALYVDRGPSRYYMRASVDVFDLSRDFVYSTEGHIEYYDAARRIWYSRTSEASNTPKRFELYSWDGLFENLRSKMSPELGIIKTKSGQLVFGYEYSVRDRGSIEAVFKIFSPENLVEMHLRYDDNYYLIEDSRYFSEDDLEEIKEERLAIKQVLRQMAESVNFFGPPQSPTDLLSNFYRVEVSLKPDVENTEYKETNIEIHSVLTKVLGILYTDINILSYDATKYSPYGQERFNAEYLLLLNRGKSVNPGLYESEGVIMKVSKADPKLIPYTLDVGYCEFDSDCSVGGYYCGIGSYNVYRVASRGWGCVGSDNIVDEVGTQYQQEDPQELLRLCPTGYPQVEYSGSKCVNNVCLPIGRTVTCDRR